MLFRKQAKDKSVSFIEVKSLYLSTPPPHFNPILTSCFSRRRHTVARHGVAIEGKNNWQPNIVPVVKSRRMRWAGHVARMGEGRGVHRVLVGET